MKQDGHGRRYSEEEKRDILFFLETHTYKETSNKYNISQTTLARWRKTLSKSVSDIKPKIIIGINQYWLNYLNEKIASGVWENYDEAMVELLRYYENSTKEKNIININYSLNSNLNDFIRNMKEENPRIRELAIIHNQTLKYKTKEWSIDEVIPIIDCWNHFYQNGNPILTIKENKFVLKLTENQALFTSIGKPNPTLKVDSQMKKIDSKIEVNTKYKVDAKLKKYPKISLKEWEDANIEKEYILGFKITDLKNEWFVLAHFVEQRFYSMDIVHDFYNSIRNFIKKNQNLHVEN